MRSQLQRRYWREGLSQGLTIAEWEAREGLGLFSVCPEAEQARSVSDRGRFMYCTATDEERALINAERTKTARKRLHDPHH
jgi:hypothetical protein